MASFLDLFNVADSDGAKAASYQLHYIGSGLSNQDSWVFGMATTLIYTAFKMIAVAANGLMGLVLSSASWLDPLSDGYRAVTAPIYAVFPPWAIACLGLGVVGLSALRSRPQATTNGLFNSETLDRIGVALAMMLMVVILTHDPFAIITRIMELANGFSVSLSAAVTNSGQTSTITAGNALVDSSIRTPTIALNYGDGFSDTCKTAWSQAMMAGRELPAASGCYPPDQNIASGDTVMTAALMLILPALPMLVFSVIAAWKYVLHLSMSVISAVAAAWVAAINVHKRRGFEQLSSMFALTAAHLAMAVITSMVAVALPTLVSGLATQVLSLANDDPDVQAFLLMISLGVGFAVSAWLISRITSNHGVLVRLLKTNANVTLEKTLGVAPAAKLSQVSKSFTTWSSARDAENKANPPKSATPMRSASELAKANEREERPVAKTTTTAADAQSVEQLTAAARSISDAAVEVQTPPTPIAVLPPEHDNSDSRSWAQRVDGAGDGNKIDAAVRVDTFGHFTVGADTGAGPSGAPGDEAGDVTPADPSAGSTQGESVPLESSALAPTPHPEGPAASSPPITPVPGNLFVDPALNAAAAVAGATFMMSGAAPTAYRGDSILRRFREEALLDPVPFGVRSVEHGPALVTIDETTQTAEASTTEPTKEPTPVNDQQRWNRRALLRRMRRRTEEPVTSSAKKADLPPSGLVAGANPHPASFQAPLPDFLAEAALEAEMDAVATTMAAAGTPVRLSVPAGDSRIRLRLTSDPDRRVVDGASTGFGDPY